ncbi:hypothetical protein [Flavobacterium cheniae]|uniref:Lipoprotein n=1 Tax=Flavobacterium cheniae TaxID=295428 RepID=A0A562KJU3_9FLAO|nr:hypothetical protein [Flavobacterium cheniae]TDR26046.1 hypothetical protein C8D80_0837 [Flavobacterium cheniae]TWH95652.1 hypothetical protein IP97_01330 [Flavobacterium cheniae]
MKKITLLIAFIGMITLQSCTVNEEQNNVDNDTISEVFEYSNVDLTSGNGYSALLTFPHATYTSDMVLVYRLVDYGSAGDVWKLLPETYYFNDGTLDFGYDNDFTRYDAQVSLFGYDLPNLSNVYKLDQVFRVVVIPAYFGNKTAAGKLDFEDYNSVKEYYKLDNAKVTKIKM